MLVTFQLGDDYPRGAHIGRQVVAAPLPDLSGPLPPGHDDGYQPDHHAIAFFRHYRGLSYAGHPCDLAFDFFQLDPEATDLHLVILPAEELKQAAVVG
jgi:hypothetical protein